MRKIGIFSIKTKICRQSISLRRVYILTDYFGKRNYYIFLERNKGCGRNNILITEPNENKTK